ncbi:LysR family transcriptional regulator [Ramlibacter rhizophilus]|uniref:LysR family transcriptional regulator n=1 Tax=Ramlibacter rhizophilus TaxID=1781167 RepID=A0A4Z0BVW8_9BURK|nr:LysR family transcriptional regulator [Ramlibacter rhizophilus]TFZ03467.1 LysR family transcriptional regulator [Ramlibacter rhizophilus]
MNLVWLEDFQALAASGNFSRAAEARHASQPAFSRRIRGLEEWLGSDLFDRTSQPARLTATGEWFQPIAEDLLARVRRLPSEARAVAGSNATTLRLAATHALSFTFVPHWLQSLEAHTVQGSIRLLSDVLAQCETLLEQGQVQFLVAHARAGQDTRGVPSLVIGRDMLLPVSAPNAPRRALLQFSEESGLGRILRQELGAELSALQAVFTAHLASVLKSMALEAKGIAWLPLSLVQDDLDSGRLQDADGPSNWRVPLEIRLYRRTAALSAHAEGFWQAACELAAASAASGSDATASAAAQAPMR